MLVTILQILARHIAFYYHITVFWPNMVTILVKYGNILVKYGNISSPVYSNYDCVYRLMKGAIFQKINDKNLSKG